MVVTDDCGRFVPSDILGVILDFPFSPHTRFNLKIDNICRFECHTYSLKGYGFAHIQATNWGTISRHFRLLGSVQFYWVGVVWMTSDTWPALHIPSALLFRNKAQREHPFKKIRGLLPRLSIFICRRLSNIRRVGGNSRGKTFLKSKSRGLETQ